jgi:hypothetical protein
MGGRVGGRVDRSKFNDALVLIADKPVTSN